ncbi:MAG: hypothetical protein Q8O18_14525 [Deltaproteobacteria bacterium]|nr:hypothetical protein [Deltaproteobacteria bacterium]
MEAKDAYLKLAEMMRYPESKELISLLQFLLTPIQAQIAASLPASHQELARKFGLSAEEVDKNLRDMFNRGLIFPKDFSTMDGARFARSLPQLHDANLSDLRWDPKKESELAQKWQAFYRSGYDRDHALWFLPLGERGTGGGSDDRNSPRINPPAALPAAHAAMALPMWPVTAPTA